MPESARRRKAMNQTETTVITTSQGHNLGMSSS
eukprot:CAMPEP_0203930054 /NCGR_PEP_ID=MMETSP0359-20131031/68867_1 /ASSEMBLY_ACC=CAM_ASM_000338 /TAXON_ID=268821 /ORGANISM="Scrippsiella Hangoei, Strain SHTV-5" /LENGTH=32 /DNA_ID= /DNA_START= /DNA_END= /DNA_ORIENTATION=